MFFCPDDLSVLENFAYGDTPTEPAVAGLVADVFNQGDEFDLSVYDLSNKHDIRNTVARTLLTYLELLGHIEAGTPFYAEYEFKPLVSSAEILSHFEGQRKAFLQKLLAQAKKAKTWFHIDLDEACANIGQPRDRVVRALDYLAEQKWLELRTAGVRQKYYLRNRPADQPALVKTLYTRVLQRESREIERLRQVARWVEQDACQVASLGKHFGDPMERPCGHCSWCQRGGKRANPPARMTQGIDATIWSQAESVRQQHQNELDQPRAFARFLCGVSSPRLVKAKLQQHRLFGALAGVPFGDVLSKVGPSWREGH